MRRTFVRTSIRLLASAALVASYLTFGASPAAACSCGAATDEEYVGWADVVFVGELIDYEFIEDPDGDGIWSSGDPATWTFAVDEVFKGTATRVQPVLSAVDGATCGLEILGIPRGPVEGTFLVFANEIAQGQEFELAEGELTANLCDGTRSIDNGPLGVDLVGQAPDDDPPPPPSTAAPTTTEPASESSDDSSGIVFVVGFVLVGVTAVVVGAALARRSRVG